MGHFIRLTIANNLQHSSPPFLVLCPEMAPAKLIKQAGTWIYAGHIAMQTSVKQITKLTDSTPMKNKHQHQKNTQTKNIQLPNADGTLMPLRQMVHGKLYAAIATN